MEGNNIVSTRIRLARNLDGTPFPVKLTPARKKELLLKVKDTAKTLFPELDYIDAMQLTAAQAGTLMEEHLISPEFANKREGAGLLLSKDRSAAIMLNEEDHLRIQTFEKGFALEKTYERAVVIDKALDGRLKFAFDTKLGYLTQCPTNLGTAMRASVLIHLPALTESGIINKTASLISQYGFTVRGLYGEGTRSVGALYQISNQVSLGVTEEEILERLGEITDRITENEKAVRSKAAGRADVQDRIFRAYGLLRSARLMTSEEAIGLLSELRFGAEAGLVDLDTAKIDGLLVRIQPYGIADGDAQNRDIKRAEILRTELS